MEITHSYEIRELEQLNNDTGTVSNVRFKITSTDGTHVIESHECIPLDTDNIENFIEYQNLTEEIVLNWLYQHNDVGLIKDQHIKWIELQINPPKSATIVTSLPWL